MNCFYYKLYVIVIYILEFDTHTYVNIVSSVMIHHYLEYFNL